jgi:asparagine synthase (glutamine-hydrolysing)
MCGIAGICSAHEPLAGRHRLQVMADSLRHRGPDGEGFYTGRHDQVYVGLAHRRLAITDASDRHIQPFRYLNRFVVVHNGEIYNHGEIRQRLEQQGYIFSTSGDTEVIAAAYAAMGPDCLQEFDGMFAFAVWDETTGTLFCARDRFGEKPLFYHLDEESRTLCFASEMKALWSGGVQKKIQPSMFLHYLTLGLTHHPGLPQLSFYEGIFQLPAAHYLLWRPGMDGVDMDVYWDIDKETITDIGQEEAILAFRRLFEKGISRRLECQRPMAALVSGGLDSTALLAAARNLQGPLPSYSGRTGPLTSSASWGVLNTGTEGNHAVKTQSSRMISDSFSAIFPGYEKNESDAITAVNRHFNLSPHLKEPSGEALAASMENLAWHQEEPFSSASVWAQHTVYGYAKQEGYTVMMDGQGADELLAGYERYIPWGLRELEGSSRKEQRGKPKGLNPGDQVSGPESFRENGFEFAWDYRGRISARFPGFTTAFLESRARREHARHPYIDARFLDAFSGSGFIHKPIIRRLNDILYHDTLQGPLQELLRYADRNAMAHGVEARLPFLFHELAELLFSLPANLKLRDGWTKWILRESYRPSIPEEILYRKGKTGFEPPQKAWMSLPVVEQSIQKARQKLVDAGMLKPSVLTKPVRPHSAYERHPYDWRTWVAAQFI